MLWKRNFSLHQSPYHNLQQIYSQNSSFSQKNNKRSFHSKDHTKQKKILNSLRNDLVTIDSAIKIKKAKTIYLCKGNNHTLVRDIFLAHGFVETISKQDAFIIWAQWSQQIPRIPQTCLAINFLENHQTITNKQRLFRHIIRYNKGQGKNGKYLPDTYIIDFKNQFHDPGFGQFFARYFAPKDMRMKLRKLQQKNQDFNVCNGYGNFTTLFKKIYLQQSSKDPYFQRKPPIWILKPTSLNRGRGINLFNNLKQLKNLLSQDYYQMSMNMYQQSHSPASYVIQEYIQRPLLIQGYKFDIRMWSVVTMDRSQKKMKAYLYQEGYVRLSGTKYHQVTRNQNEQQEDQNIKDGRDGEKIQLPKNTTISQNKQKTIKNIINDKFMHLTNNSVQKYSKNYGNLYEGNIMPLKDLEKYFPGKINLKQMIQTITQIMVDSLNSVKAKLGLSYTIQTKKSGKGPNQFQLFGYDFLIDNNFKIWLIEVNCNPSLQQSSQHLSKLISDMLNQMIITLKLNSYDINQSFKQTKRIQDIKQKYSNSNYGSSHSDLICLSKTESRNNQQKINKKELYLNNKLQPLTQKQKLTKINSKYFDKQKSILRISSEVNSIEKYNNQLSNQKQKQINSQPYIKVDNRKINDKQECNKNKQDNATISNIYANYQQEQQDKAKTKNQKRNDNNDNNDKSKSERNSPTLRKNQQSVINQKTQSKWIKII